MTATTYTPQIYLTITDITSSPTVVARYQNFSIDQTVSYGGNNYTFAPFDVSDMTQTNEATTLNIRITFPGMPTYVDMLNTALTTARYKASFDFTSAEITPTLFTSVVGLISGGTSDFSGVTFNISDSIDATEAQIPSRKVTYDMVAYL